MSAEAIAEASAVLAAGRPGPRFQVFDGADRAFTAYGADGVRTGSGREAHAALAEEAVVVAREADGVVDATPIYRSHRAKGERGESVAVYEDHPCIAPPWPTALLSYVNEYGNVVLLPQRAAPFDAASGHDRATVAGFEEIRNRSQPPGWATENPVDWNRVRWVIRTTVWTGGRAGGRAVPLRGPFLSWYFAVYDDGSPADLHWVNLVGDAATFPDGTSAGDPDNWQNASMVTLGVLNFMNATNVDVVEPARPRAERRRIERHGVRVKVLNVYPSRAAARRAATTGQDAGVPLTTVRGHFAHYGACCPHHEPRGLLFGKHTGRVWHPMAARGSKDRGEVAKTYRPRPEPAT